MEGGVVEHLTAIDCRKKKDGGGVVIFGILCYNERNFKARLAHLDRASVS